MLDPTTHAAYSAASGATARAEAVRDSLGSGTLTVDLRDGESLIYSGTFPGPMTAEAGALSADSLLAGAVTTGGTPDAETWTLRIRNADGRYVEGSFGPGGRFTFSGGSLVVGRAVRVAVSIAAAGASALPVAGSAMLVSPSGGHLAVKLAGSDGNATYSMFSSYGGGAYNPYYSEHGATITAATGGHGHQEFLGGVGFDWTSREWFNIPVPGWTEDVSASQLDDTDGEPWYELAGTNYPAPGHVYTLLNVLPPANGGGAKGSIISVGRAAVTGLARSTRSAHKFDCATGAWTRASADATAVTALDNYTSIFDSAMGRYYLVPDVIHSSLALRYLDVADFEYKLTPSWSEYAQTATGSYGHAFVYERGSTRLLMFCWGEKLQALNLDAISSGWTNLTYTGEEIYDAQGPNHWCFHPTHDRMYSRRTSGAGQTLLRITPPAGDLLTGAWVRDSVTLGGDTIPERVSSGLDGGRHSYRWLHYIPTLDCLGWITSNGVALLNPPEPV